MNNTEHFSRRDLMVYLLITFIPAYLIQVFAGTLYQRGNSSAGQLVLAAMMYIPAAAVLFTKDRWHKIGFRPNFRTNLRHYLCAWFLPAALTAAGALLYFIVFPSHFDTSGSYITVLAGADAIDQLKAQGISYPLYILISAVSALTYGPLINTFAAVGEEIGWRGFLYPQLKERFGVVRGVLLGGVIWGMWHWPLIALIGYEYGAAAGNRTPYLGTPVTGMILFCLCTVSFGILCDLLYEKSGSIWVPSLLHGAFNAVAALPLMLCLSDTGSARLLGPAVNGLLSGLPLLILALYLLFRKNKTEK